MLSLGGGEDEPLVYIYLSIVHVLCWEWMGICKIRYFQERPGEEGGRGGDKNIWACVYTCMLYMYVCSWSVPTKKLIHFVCNPKQHYPVVVHSCMDSCTVTMNNNNDTAIFPSSVVPERCPLDLPWLWNPKPIARFNTATLSTFITRDNSLPGPRSVCLLNIYTCYSPTRSKSIMWYNGRTCTCTCTW